MLVKERNLRKLLLLVGILMVTVVLTGCQQTGLTEEEIRSIIQEELGSAPEVIEESDTDPPTTPEIVVSAETLYVDYQSNAVAADLKYKGNLIKVTGEVTEIDTSIFGDPVVVFGMDEFNLSGVRATFKESESNNVANISIGQTITIIGTGDGKLVWALLEDCYIVNIEEGEAVLEEEEAVLGVTIPDYALEVALRDALNKPEGPIYKSDLESLTYLDLTEKNISDISVLSGLTNLETLWLWGNNITDISALSGLTNLEWLDLDENNISDISALSGLTNLEGLSLDKNNISDISALVSNAGISSGDTVYLTNNPLSPEAINIHIPQLEARGVEVIR